MQDDDAKSTEEVVDQVGKQRVQGGVDKRDLLFNKRGLKGTRLKCMCPNKEISIGQHNRKLSYLLYEMSIIWYLSELSTR